MLVSAMISMLRYKQSSFPYLLGAIISGGKGGAQDKINALEKAGVIVTRSPAQMGRELLKEMQRLELVPAAQ